MQVVGYVRVSTEEQAEQGVSIAAQKSRLIAYCKSQGWTLSNFYIDDGYSGKDLNRPAMQRLIADVMARRLDVVLVYKLDRFSRKQLDILHLLEDVFLPHNVGFTSSTEHFDTTTPFGRAALGMMAVFAQLERETIVERVKMAKKEIAKQGRFCGGNPPFGYKRQDKSIVVDEGEAQTIRLIFSKYINDNLGYDNITKLLNEMKAPNATGTTWKKDNIKKILINPHYAGKVVHQGNVTEGTHEPIIPPDQWEQVQTILEGQSRRTKRTKYFALLSGIAWCGECGARVGTRNTWVNFPCKNPIKRILYYACYTQTKSIKSSTKGPCDVGYKQVENVDSYIVKQLYKYSRDTKILEKDIDKLLVKYNSGHGDLLQVIKTYKKEYGEIDKKLERWYTIFEKGGIDPDELMDRIRTLKERKKILSRQIEETQLEIEEEKQRQINATALIEKMKNFSSIWEEATEEEKKSIIKGYIEKVVFYKFKKPEINFNI